MWYIYTIEYYSAVKWMLAVKKETILQSTNTEKLSNIEYLRGISQGKGNRIAYEGILEVGGAENKQDQVDGRKKNIQRNAGIG